MYKLSPSDFAYLFEECKLCYVLKVKDRIFQPSMPMPGVFSSINSALQGLMVGKNLQELSEDLPEGIVENQEGFVRSTQIHGTDLYISGRYDLLVRQNDGSYMLIDLKITPALEEKITKYSTQLHAYKYAFEHPQSGDPIEVSRMGLLTLYPEDASFVDGHAIVHFPPKWLEVPIDNEAFFTFIGEVNALLTGPIPEENHNCKWCQYRHFGEKSTHGEEHEKF